MKEQLVTELMQILKEDPGSSKISLDSIESGEIPQGWSYHHYCPITQNEIDPNADFFPRIEEGDLKNQANQVLLEFVENCTDLDPHQLYTAWRLGLAVLGGGALEDDEERRKRKITEIKVYRKCVEQVVGVKGADILEMALSKNDVDYEDPNIKATI